MFQRSLMHGSWLVGALALLAAGCSSAREVEVTGEVSAAATPTHLVLEFFELHEDQTPRSVSQVELSELGTFTQKVELEGDSLLIRALDDADGDGKCSAGEQWAEIEAPVKDDKVATVQLAMNVKACPAE